MNRRITRDEQGSTLLLTLGYVLLALAVILVCANASSLYLAQKRLDSLADSAALAGADGFRIELVGDEPRAVLIDASVTDQATAVVAASGGGAELVSSGTPDGVSARVTVADVWHPILVSPFVPGGVQIEATATSRTVLN
ncbi:pilus assembly protein TadG-related protein [Microbacterium halotolerans]|uniref:pilus assembly protein TadG-related protein n=1 Tax=Microbacterium halotolerans TaxID=246613 RepID=UPI000E6ABB01|nr:pilus assembly protein TadG-related protein [Microbacterium halotolerans]